MDWPNLIVPPETGRLYSAKIENANLAASGTQNLMDISGCGCIRSLFVAINGSHYTVNERTLINIYIDGSASPDVSTTLVNFSFADYAPSSFGAPYAGFSVSGNYKSYYRIINVPFKTSIKIDIVNGSSSYSGTLWAMASYHYDYPTEWGRYYRLKSYEQRVSAITAYAVQDILNISGRGVLHSIYMLMSNAFNYNFLEGNLKFYIDGEASPSYESPGTEDYFRWGFYGQGGVYASAFNGMPKRTDYSIGFYRIHIPDPVPFDSSLHITWDCGDASQATVTGTTYLSSEALYYLDA